MKQLEEMSREELVQEIIANSKRLEEIEATCLKSEHRRAELEKQAEQLKNIEKSISQVESGMAEEIPKLQKEIDAMERENSSHRDS